MRILFIGDVVGRSGRTAIGEHLPGAIARFSDTGEAVDGVRRYLRDDDVVLVKGSRGMKMERIVDALLYWPSRTEA